MANTLALARKLVKEAAEFLETVYDDIRTPRFPRPGRLQTICAPTNLAGYFSLSGGSRFCARVSAGIFIAIIGIIIPVLVPGHELSELNKMG